MAPRSCRSSCLRATGKFFGASLGQFVSFLAAEVGEHAVAYLGQRALMRRLNVRNVAQTVIRQGYAVYAFGDHDEPARATLPSNVAGV